MFDRIFALAAALASAIVGPPAVAQEASFAPVGGWRADFADESCSLERDFGLGSDTALLRLRQFAPGGRFEITVASGTLNVRTNRPRITFAAAGDRHPVEFYDAFEIENGLEGVTFTAALDETGNDVPEQGTDDFAVYATGKAIEQLAFENAFGRDLTLRTGSMEHPLEVMRTCMEDLMTSWGLDPLAHRTLTRKAAPDWDAEWLSVTAPMQREFLTRESYQQSVRLLLDEQGKPFGCLVEGWAAEEPVARRLCDVLMEKAVLIPALDSASRPIKSYFVLVLSAVPRPG